MFRSSQYQKNETELVTLVTPHLVKPMAPGAARLPTDKCIEPNDMEIYLLGLQRARAACAAAAGHHRQSAAGLREPKRAINPGAGCRTNFSNRQGRMKNETRKKASRYGKVWLVLVTGLIFLGPAGCYSNALEQDFGQSVADNIAQQVVNPQAGLVPTASVGLSPTAGANTIDQYEKSFKSEEKTGPQLKSISPY